MQPRGRPCRACLRAGCDLRSPAVSSKWWGLAGDHQAAYRGRSLHFWETDDGALLEAFVVLARASFGQIREPKAETAALLQKYRDEPIIPIVLYELAVHSAMACGRTELFKAAFAKRNRGNSATRR